MANVNYTVVLDLTDNGCINTGWRLKQGDNGNSTIVVKIVDNGVDVYEPLSTPDIAFKRADGTSVLSTMTASDGYYNYTFVGNELAVAGPVVMDVTFTDEEARTSTASCRFEVVENPAGYDPEGAHTYDNPVSVLVEEAKKDASDAEAWSSGTRNGEPVSSGDPAYHNNSKYWSEQSNPTLLQNLQDVVLNSPTEGQALIYDATNEVWKNGNGGGSGSSTLSGLTDVNLESPVNGEALIYDSLNQEWINGQAGATSLNGLTDVVLTTPSNNQVLKYDSVNHVWKNANESGGGGGLLPHFNIHSEHGSVVTVTYPDGVTTITATETSSGLFECDVTEFGVYTIDAILSGDDAQVHQTVDAVMIYEIHDEHYSYALSVYAPSGSTIRVSATGESYTGTGAGSTAAVFALHQASTTYTIQVTIDGLSKSTTKTSAATTGQSGSVTIEFGTINVTLDSDFIGETITCTKGALSISKVASSTSMVFYPSEVGTWTVAVDGTSTSAEAEVVDLNTPVSVALSSIQTITVTLYSATEDTVTFTDASGVQKTEVFASGQSSKSINIEIDSSGSTITFTSSVAKNPDDLSQYYSKALTVTTNTTELYLMPDAIKTLYWWGYESDNLEDASNANGWSRTQYTLRGMTHNKNDMLSYPQAGYYISAIGTKNQVSASKFHAISVGVTMVSGEYGDMRTTSTKAIDAPSSRVSLDSTTMSHFEESVSIVGYTSITSWSDAQIRVYALWYE